MDGALASILKNRNNIDYAHPIKNEPITGVIYCCIKKTQNTLVTTLPIHIRFRNICSPMQSIAHLLMQIMRY